jgi:hypothetical protein
MEAHQSCTGPRVPAQLGLGLNSGPDIDLQDQAKGPRGLVVRRNPTTGERHLNELIWGLLRQGTKNLAAAPRPISARRGGDGSSLMDATRARMRYAYKRPSVQSVHFVSASAGWHCRWAYCTDVGQAAMPSCRVGTLTHRRRHP